MWIICSFEGCGKRADGRGLCPGHRRQQKLGKPLTPLQVQYHGLSEDQRFMRRVDKRARNECWPWTGSRLSKGWHGQFRNGAGQIEPSSRAAWRLLVGPIPVGMFVLHRCDNPICCNPSHLFLGTQSDNLKDMWAKRRARPKTNLGEKHGMSKVTVEIVRDIRDSSLSGVALAKKHGITPTTVCDIRKRRTWNHIP